MSYSTTPNGLTFAQIDGCISRMKQLKLELEQHQASDDCTHTSDCPKCKELNERIIAEDPTLP